VHGIVAFRRGSTPGGRGEPRPTYSDRSDEGHQRRPTVTPEATLRPPLRQRRAKCQFTRRASWSRSDRQTGTAYPPLRRRLHAWQNPRDARLAAARARRTADGDGQGSRYQLSAAS
jgi:hypothetical protein